MPVSGITVTNIIAQRIDLTPEVMKVYLGLTAADGFKALLSDRGSDPLVRTLRYLQTTACLIFFTQDDSLKLLALGAKTPCKRVSAVC
jgi:hypothetical protein